MLLLRLANSVFFPPGAGRNQVHLNSRGAKMTMSISFPIICRENDRNSLYLLRYREFFVRYGVPAIHRGQLPCVQMLVEGGSAHDATNLFYRGRNHPLQGIVEAGVAHGELQGLLNLQTVGE